MQQMEWREALDDAKAAKDIDALEKLDAELKMAHKVEVAQIGNLLDAADFTQAAQGVRQLMFLEKFGEEIDSALQHLE